MRIERRWLLDHGRRDTRAIADDRRRVCPPPHSPSPDSVFEGITASKGFVDYWNREAPVPGIDASRTLFHISP